MRNLYISDSHFHHDNIIMYDNRPFSDVYQMNQKMVDNWNAVVTDEDIVYVLGDFSWGKYEEWIDIIRKLNGKIYFIKGNHDKESYLDKLLQDRRVKDKVLGWDHYKEISDCGRMVCMSHYFIQSHNGMFRGSTLLYGHVHASYDYKICLKIKQLTEALYCRNLTSFNVGAMMPYISYTPRTLDEIVAGYQHLKLQELEFTRLSGIKNVDVELFKLENEGGKNAPEETSVQD